MSPLPRLSTIEPGASFTEALARGVMDAYDKADNPLALADVLILLPTRRAVRAATDAFGRIAQARGHSTVFLPRLQPLGDVDEELMMLESFTLDVETHLSVLPAIDETERAFELARLIARKFESRGGPAPMDQCVALAYSLAQFIDTAHTERVTLDGLAALVPEHFAAHWQETLEFLEIVLSAWPAHLREIGKIDPAERRNNLLGALSARWRTQPPDHPVIAAGTTGSIPATADLLKVIANLPKGHIVLPGLDREASATSWDALEPSHPQFGLRALLTHIGADRHDVKTWPDEAHEIPRARRRLINEALRPSTATDEWIDTAKALAQGDPCAGLSFLVAKNSGEEALAIALLLREAVETPGRSAALVTPDRTLARRVAAELGRYDINIDDSAGQPLDQTAPASFFLHLVEAAASGWAPVPLLAFLKHPLFLAGRERGEARKAIDALEAYALRGVTLSKGLAAYTDKLEAAKAATKDTNTRGALGRALDLLRDIFEATNELAEDAPRTLAVWAQAHNAVAVALASDKEGLATELWRGPAGEQLSESVASLLKADDAPGEMDLGTYAKLLRMLMAKRPVRRQENQHPRIFIWGPLEARLQQADLVILGGLTEGVWPVEVRLDPWLSRPMREGLGLAAPERQIGLAAHDFAQLASSPEVVLSRAEKVDGKPAVPSRWWLRLENLLSGAGLPTVEERSVDHTLWARHLDEPKDGPKPVAPPAPKPPVAVRPRKLAVTRVENWLRDPYFIYARYILGLERLELIDQEPGPSDRGALIHGIMEDFVKAFPAALPDDALAQLVEMGRRRFAAYADVPQVGAVWWPRFERIAEWVIGFERTHREGITQAIAERKGELTFDAPGGPFTLRGRADRIDLYTDGMLGLIDYKTGTLPKKDYCETGLQPQLTLEAAMMVEGAFGEDLALAARALLYIRLVGGRSEGEVRAVGSGDAPPMELAEEALTNFKDLVAAFDKPSRTYPSQPRPQFAHSYGDYDHLARRLEWSVGKGGEGGGDG